jgi:hypothetical protein
MSRNLNRTICDFCRGTVQLDEEPRLITREEAGIHYDTRGGYGFAGMICANATCVACGAEYLAWVSLRNCAGYGQHANHVEGSPFFDLSFRSTFHDCPGESDRPKRGYKLDSGVDDTSQAAWCLYERGERTVMSLMVEILRHFSREDCEVPCRYCADTSLFDVDARWLIVEGATHHE